MPWLNRIVGQSDVRPDDLIANPANWRRHPKAQRAAIAAALGLVGWVQQVIRNIRTGHILDGHARIEEAIARGEPSIPVLDVDLSLEEERLVLATFDPLGAMATADATRLEELLAELAPVNDAALRALLDGLADQAGLARTGLGDPDEVPPEPDESEVYVRPGQLWILGDHRLMAADSTDRDSVARLMDSQLAECLWTDVPYGVGYVGKTADRLTIENDDPARSDGVVRGAFEIAPLAPSARFYVAAPTGPRSLGFLLALKEAGWRLHQQLVWVKDSFVLGHSDYHLQHEGIFFGYVPGPGRPGRGRHEGSKWYGDNAQSSVLAYPKPVANRSHPTAKPVALVEHCLRNSTARGDLIYEPFAGSGTTLIAAEELGRRCFAMELSPSFVQVTIERWQSFTGRKAVRHD